jgi:lipopolysaccharide export LptBFGC system permease protein LptF
LTLSDVRLYEFEPSGLARFESAKIAKGELSQRVDFQQAANGLPEEQLAYLSFNQLTRMRDDALRFRDKDRALQCDANRWFKFALPLMSLPCALCGAALALRFARGGSFAGILLSLGVVFVSYAVLSGMKYAAIAGKLPALPAACFAPLIFLVAAAVHLRRQE